MGHKPGTLAAAGGSGGSNASFYAMYNAAISGDPLAIQQYAAEHGTSIYNRAIDGPLQSLSITHADGYFDYNYRTGPGGSIGNSQTARSGRILAGDFVNTLDGSFIINYGVTSYKGESGDTMIGEFFYAYFYKSNNKYQSFQWIQTYIESVNGGETVFARDGLALPFYMDQKTSDDYARLVKSDAYFGDRPAANYSVTSRYVNFETTLLGKGNNGKYSPLGSFQWGFYTQGSNVFLNSVYYFSTPSPGNNNIIQEINQSH
jgi:uncharacterized protein (DUF779 family)